ncbi:MAG: aromatic ring-hydroxylating dioxygenase subunit alpha [Tissierellales bacterium]
MTAKPWSFYQDLIATDTRIPPEDIREPIDSDLGLADSPRSLYTSPEIHNLEMARLWPRIWQFACREEQIAEPGDIHVYEVGDYSILVVRTDEGIKAYYNSCTHRATKLCSSDTHLQQLRCPFHGFTWDLHGTLTSMPCRWDFPQITDDSHNLDEVKVGLWGGFVFINFDPDANPLEDYLDVLPDHLAERRFEDMYIVGNYRKILPSNWKASIEAFLESMHVTETHWQTMTFSDDVNTQYDLYGENISRFLTAIGVANSAMEDKPSEQQVLDALFAETVRPPMDAPKLPEGMSARAFAVAGMREQLGEAVSNLSDAELIDAMQYSVFPNMVLFRSIGFPAVYRFLPNGNDPDTSIFDMLILQHVPPGQDRPEPAERVDLGDRPFADVVELPDWLRLIYDQDVGNLALQQKGFKASGRTGVTLSRYHESRIRHYHQTLQSYLERP